VITIGLTGSIGMGKSRTAVLLRQLGCAVHSADAAVHRLLRVGGAAVAPVAALFPAVQRDGEIDRAALGALVFPDPAQRQALEAILHPLVQQAEAAKRVRAETAGRRWLVLDIPLLFETGAERRCDVTLCVTASAAQQRQRVLARAGMTAAKFQQILAAQMPDAEKRRRADYVIQTGYGLCVTRWQLRWVLSRIVNVPDKPDA
jgi:dephospho-CoA kinase